MSYATNSRIRYSVYGHVFYQDQVDTTVEVSNLPPTPAPPGFSQHTTDENLLAYHDRTDKLFILRREFDYYLDSIFTIPSKLTENDETNLDIITTLDSQYDRQWAHYKTGQESI